MIQIERRSFLKAVLVLVTAPAIVRACNIMPIKNVVLDGTRWHHITVDAEMSRLLVGDGITYVDAGLVQSIGKIGDGFSAWLEIKDVDYANLINPAYLKKLT